MSLIKSYRDRLAKDAQRRRRLADPRTAGIPARAGRRRRRRAPPGRDPPARGSPARLLSRPGPGPGRPARAGRRGLRAAPCSASPPRNDLLEIFQALGRVYQRTQKADQALAVWARLEALFPDDPRVQEQIATALAEEDQPAQALPRFEALARKVADPFRQVQLAMQAAELKVRLGRSEEALKDFEAMLGEAPSR